MKFQDSSFKGLKVTVGTKSVDTGYPHDGRADKDSYRHDRDNQYIMLSSELWLSLSTDKLA